MAILLSISITKLNRNRVVASSAIPEDTSSSSSSPSLSSRPNIIKTNPNKLPKTDYKKRQQQQQPSILEIERAIGAGIFRDRDVNSGGEEQTNGLFDNILKNTVGKNEGSAEKRLRETGEWLVRKTDTSSGSAGKQILKFIFVWMIPLWVTAFLVATGVVRLPFLTPFLEDFIS